MGGFLCFDLKTCTHANTTHPVENPWRLFVFSTWDVWQVVDTCWKLMICVAFNRGGIAQLLVFLCLPEYFLIGHTPSEIMSLQSYKIWGNNMSFVLLSYSMRRITIFFFRGPQILSPSSKAIVPLNFHFLDGETVFLCQKPGLQSWILLWEEWFSWTNLDWK